MEITAWPITDITEIKNILKLPSSGIYLRPDDVALCDCVLFVVRLPEFVIVLKNCRPSLIRLTNLTELGTLEKRCVLFDKLFHRCAGVWAEVWAGLGSDSNGRCHRAL